MKKQQTLCVVILFCLAGMLTSCGGNGKEILGLFHCGMALPEFDIGVRTGGIFGEKAQGGEVARDRQYGAGGKIDADADDIIR